MSLFGLDYTSGSVNVDCLKKQGAKFVCRYLAPPGRAYDWKRLTAGEVGRVLAVGLKLVLVFESSAGRAKGGAPAGRADALMARDAVVTLGLPPSSPVYFAIDFDARPGEQAAINAYLTAAGLVLGKNRVGVYGGYYVVKRALDAGVCKYAWQTYAWSGGQWDRRAQLQQYSNGHRACGISVDYNRSMADDFGQVGYKAPPRKPVKPFKLEITDRDGTKHYEQAGRAGVLFRVNRLLGGRFRELNITRQ